MKVNILNDGFFSQTGSLLFLIAESQAFEGLLNETFCELWIVRSHIPPEKYFLKKILCSLKAVREC